MSKLVRRLSSCLLLLTLTLLFSLTCRPASAADPAVVATGEISGFSINSLGESVWTGYDMQTGYSQIFSSKRGQLTFDRVHHMDPSINNLGDIAWIDWSTSTVMGIIGGKKVVIAPGVNRNRYGTDINDHGEVVWSEEAWPNDDPYIVYGGCNIISNLRGQLTSGFFRNERPSINNRGDVFYFVHDVERVTPVPFQLYKLPAGSSTPVAVTSTNYDVINGAINDSGEMVWGEYDQQNVMPGQVISDRRGVLTQIPAARLLGVDLNNCGDVLYLQTADGNTGSLLQLGSAAPCPGVSGNNTRETAAQATLGDAVLGAVDTASPVSWYRFDAAARDFIKVRVNYQKDAGPLEIGLYDEQGNLLSGPVSSDPLSIINKAPYTGSYYLKVTGQGGQRVGFAVSFTTLFSCGSGPCPEIIADADVRGGVGINSLGEAVWSQAATSSAAEQIFSSARGQLTTYQINSSPAINALGDMVYVVSNGYSWAPWYAVISIINGREMPLFTSDNVIEKVDINDRQEIVWSQYEGPGFGIYSNRRGRLVSGSKPSINNRGDIFYIFTDPANPGAGQVYKLPAGSTEPVAVTADALDHRAVAANDVEAVWVDFDPATSAARIFSSSRGVLLSGLEAGGVDVNSCGDVVFSSAIGMSRLGAGVPCASYPGSHGTQEEAAPLAFGDIVTGTTEAGASSWFRFEGQAGGQMYLNLNWDKSAAKALKFYVYDPTGGWFQSWVEPGYPIYVDTRWNGSYYLKIEGSGASFFYAVSASKYSVNCGAEVCPDLVWLNYTGPTVAINSLGEIATTQYAGGYPQVFTTTRGQLTSDPAEHSSVALNDLGDLVWVSRDASSSPERYAVQGLIGGNAVTVASSATPIKKADLNDQGEVVWSQQDNGEWFIYSNRRGRLVKGANPTINNSGELTFTGSEGGSEVFKLAAGGAAPERLATDGNPRLALALSDRELVSLVDDKAGSRQLITSSTRGLLLPAVDVYGLDANSCGDVAYLVPNPWGGGMSIYRFGKHTPCLSHPGVHDTRETAAAVAAESTVTAATSGESPVSWYRFEATEGQSFAIRAYYDTRVYGNELLVSVCDADGNPLTGAYASGVEFTAPAAGIYYVKAEGTRMGDNFGFGYSLSLRGKPAQLLKWVAEGEPEWYYASLQESLFHLPAAPELKLLLRDGELSGNLSVNVCEKTVRLSGGYDALFATVFGRTRLSGAVRVSCGKLVADGIVIR